jgi:hypothetical protein
VSRAAPGSGASCVASARIIVRGAIVVAVVVGSIAVGVVVRGA